MISRILLKGLSKAKAASAPVMKTGVYRSFSELMKQKGKVAQILTQELEFEKDNYEHDESVDFYLRDNGWVLNEDESSNLLVLNKPLKGADIKVYFTSRAPNMEDEMEEDEEFEGEEEAQGMNDFNFDLCEFTIYVEKDPNTILAIEALSMDGRLQVNTLNVIDDINTHRQLNPFTTTLNNYRGPEFTSLDETLQFSLMDYMRSIGIDEEFGSLVEVLSLDKEQRLYMTWLDNLSGFVN